MMTPVLDSFLTRRMWMLRDKILARICDGRIKKLYREPSSNLGTISDGLAICLLWSITS